MIIHGIDAWQPTGNPFTNWCARRVDRFLAVSSFTRQKFCAWTRLPAEHGVILPDCVDLETFTPGPRNPDLLRRYQLEDCRVILTLARLDARERYKGIDEVLESLSELRRTVPNLVYLICGDGTDRPRLEQKTRAFGLSNAVRFAGRIPEQEKVDHYRMADAFVMPGRGEGFGIVYLEAMGCGVPVVASILDASREAVLNGQLGVVVDPRNRSDLHRGILEALSRPAGVRPDGLEHFSFSAFEQRIRELFPLPTGDAVPQDKSQQKTEKLKR